MPDTLHNTKVIELGPCYKVDVNCEYQVTILRRREKLCYGNEYTRFCFKGANNDNDDNDNNHNNNNNNNNNKTKRKQKRREKFFKKLKYIVKEKYSFF